jgi:hypothetical protein
MGRLAAADLSLRVLARRVAGQTSGWLAPRGRGTRTATNVTLFCRGWNAQRHQQTYGGPHLTEPGPRTPLAGLR